MSCTFVFLPLGTSGQNVHALRIHAPSPSLICQHHLCAIFLVTNIWSQRRSLIESSQWPVRLWRSDFPLERKWKKKRKREAWGGGEREGDVAAAKTQLQRDDKGWEKARSKEEDLRIKMKFVEDWRWIDRYWDSPYADCQREEKRKWLLN